MMDGGDMTWNSRASGALMEHGFGESGIAMLILKMKPGQGLFTEVETNVRFSWRRTLHPRQILSIHLAQKFGLVQVGRQWQAGDRLARCAEPIPV